MRLDDEAKRALAELEATGLSRPKLSGVVWFKRPGACVTGNDWLPKLRHWSTTNKIERELRRCLT